MMFHYGFVLVCHYFKVWERAGNMFVVIGGLSQCLEHISDVFVTPWIFWNVFHVNFTFEWSWYPYIDPPSPDL